MPIVDLRDKDDQTRLQPLAHFIVLAAMMKPKQKVERERIMDSVRHEIGEKHIRRGLLTEKESNIVQLLGCSRGAEAGFMLGALIQLSSQVKTPSLSSAIKILVGELPPIPMGWKENWNPEHSHEHFPRSPRILRKVFQDFGSVAHLWSAFLHGEQWDNWRQTRGKIGDNGLLPITLNMLPNFLGTATAIRQLYEQIPTLKRGNGVTYIKDPWNFVIPHSLRVERALRAMPIPDDRLNWITRPN